MRKTQILAILVVILAAVAAFESTVLYSRGVALRKIEEEREELHAEMLAAKDAILPLKLLPGTKVYRSDADTIDFSGDLESEWESGHMSAHQFWLDVSGTKWTGLAAREGRLETRIAVVVWHITKHIRDAFPGLAKAYILERVQPSRSMSATGMLTFRNGSVVVAGAYAYEKDNPALVGDLIRVIIYRQHRSDHSLPGYDAGGINN